MMDPFTGDAKMLDAFTFDAARAEAAQFPDRMLVWGTEDQVAAASLRIRLGNRELENRAARRRQQKASRRRNR
jgi:hypothetical protein